MATLSCPGNFEDERHLPPDDILSQIGRIALVAASIEDILHAIYWKHAKLSDEVGAVITVDVSPNRLMEDIVKVAKASSAAPEIIADLKDIFDAFRPMATKRNQLIHWVWHPSKNGMLVIEPPSYKTGRQQVITSFKEIKELADQLTWIEARLASHAMDDAALRLERAKLGANGDVRMPAPWLE